MGDWHELKAADGTVVPVQAFAATGRPKAVFVMLPALGVQARLYARLAAGLAEGGITTVLVEQRGHGKSPYRAGRGKSFGFKDFLDVDIALVLSWVRMTYPGQPFYLGGHSLGGHFSSIVAGRRPDRIKGVIHLATGFPYHGFFDRKAASKIKTLCLLLPLTTLIYGYFPGHKLGFGGCEYRRLMLDWRAWARKGSYNAGFDDPVEDQIATYTGRVLSIAFDQDDYASDKATGYCHSRFKSADVTALTLGAAEQGEHLGHFDWARKPNGTVKAILDWL